MKFNWGHGITVFYIIFVIAMVSMVVKSYDFNSQLVVDDYYQKDLDYEDFRVKRQNATQLGNELTVKTNTQSRVVNVQFPTWMKNVKGNIRLYRPANQDLDTSYKLIVDTNNVVNLQLDQALSKGLWQLQLEWKDSKKGYYYETDIYL